MGCGGGLFLLAPRPLPPAPPASYPSSLLIISLLATPAASCMSPVMSSIPFDLHARCFGPQSLMYAPSLYVPFAPPHQPPAPM